MELASIERPELTAEARALESLLILHFDGRNLSLPPMPHVPERVLRIMSNRKFEMSQVAGEIGTDQVTAAAVLRMSNSPLYAGLQKTTAIGPAVVRLGTSAIRAAMLNLSMRSVAFKEQRKGNNRAETLWMRALAGSMVMRMLSRFTRVDPEEAFLMGLLHDVGNIIVLRIVNGQQASMKVQIADDTFEYLCHEAHQEFGELLAVAWALPVRLKTLISDHHTYPEPDQSYRIERLQLHLTDMICAQLSYAPYVAYNLLESRAVADLGLADHPDFIAFLDSLPEKLTESLEALF